MLMLSALRGMPEKMLRMRKEACCLWDGKISKSYEWDVNYDTDIISLMTGRARWHDY